MSKRPRGGASDGDLSEDGYSIFSRDPRLPPPPGMSGTPAEKAARWIDEDPRPEAVTFALDFFGVTKEEVAAARKEAHGSTGRR